VSGKGHKPEWVPSQGGEGFATSVMKGVDGGHDGTRGGASAPNQSRPRPKRRQLDVAEHVAGVLAGDRNILARTITLIESNAHAHFEKAQEVLGELLTHAGESMRIGITGVPGVGKSTFIEEFGSFLTERGHRVAVLAVDPSSTLTRGSILGDKTRMEKLARNPNAFIRPSPAGGTLGGVARKSRETMLVCEAAGFNVILVETVGVGQSEVTVRSMVDFFLLLMLTGAGDELQGIKKGIMELADALLINKADGDNKLRAQAAKVDYDRALHYLSPATEGWQTRAHTCSALTGEGIKEMWGEIERFREQTTSSGVFESRRRKQTLAWVYSMIEVQLRTRFFEHTGVESVRAEIEQAVVAGQMPPTVAAQKLLQRFDGG
jgi:LAO/AO transport system kinase